MALTPAAPSRLVLVAFLNDPAAEEASSQDTSLIPAEGPALTAPMYVVKVPIALGAPLPFTFSIPDEVVEHLLSAPHDGQDGRR